MPTRLTVKHTTVYRYARPVTFNEHRLMFRPRDSHDMRLLSTGLTIAPPARVRWLHDVFGNSIAIASFAEAAERLHLESVFTVEHFGLSEAEFPIESYARTVPFSYPRDEVPDLGRTIERHYEDAEHTVDAWVRRFLAPDGWTETDALLVAMTRAIHQNFAYQTRSNGIQTPAETLKRMAGTCRDLALLMMEAVRSLGMAARFVSGYLYDPALDGAERGMVGAGSTHAWVQVYLPGSGWVEFDPTNGLVGGPNLIRVAVARDPSQAIPVQGTYTGSKEDFLDMSVEVVVTAEPIS
ncbi:MAG: transglutaminase N-terminal domain-containing protein [Kiloniellaceae bacterium]